MKRASRLRCMNGACKNTHVQGLMSTASQAEVKRSVFALFSEGGAKSLKPQWRTMIVAVASTISVGSMKTASPLRESWFFFVQSAAIQREHQVVIAHTDVPHHEWQSYMKAPKTAWSCFSTMVQMAQHFHLYTTDKHAIHLQLYKICCTTTKLRSEEQQSMPHWWLKLCGIIMLNSSWAADTWSQVTLHDVPCTVSLCFTKHWTQKLIN